MARGGKKQVAGVGGGQAAFPFVQIYSDLPVPGGQKPHFEFEGLGRTLAELALNPANPTPFTAVVRGGWGRGKTTLLRHTQHLLLNPPADMIHGAEHREVRALWFNAWKYPDDDTVLAGLLGELLLELERGSPADRLKGFLENNKDRGFHTLLQMVLPVSLQALGAAIGVPPATDINPGPRRFAPVAEARAFHDTFRDLFSQLGHLLFRDADLAKPRLRPEVLWDEESRRKFVLAVFLDDLDRCRRERVTEVLEAVNLFLDLPGVCFYLGLDWDRLCALLPETVRDNANPFLEKIVQVSLDLPQIANTETESFVRDLIADTPLAAVLMAREDNGEPDDVWVIASILEGDSRHPRHVKRFLNDLAVGLAVLRNTGRLGQEEGLVPEPAVVAWHLLHEVLPAVEWRDLRANLANLKAFLLTWEAAPAQGKEIAAASGETPAEAAKAAGRVHRLRAAGLLDRHVRILKSLTETQLMSLVHLASPSPTRAFVEPRRRSDTPELNLLDPASPIWVAVPAGTFAMGSAEGDDDERPVHQVTITRPYRMTRYPVTNAQYLEFVRDVDARPPGHWTEGSVPEGLGNHPVVEVSWDDAVAFAVWLTRKLGSTKGREVRLPTEAEWEYATRGSEGRRYPWGDAEPTPEHANFGMNIRSTSPVGSFAKGATPLGIHDLAGNVWEWCWDWEGAYRSQPQRDPQGPEKGKARVLRGGSFGDHPRYLRGAYRRALLPADRDVNFGFRVVWSASGGQES